MFTLTPDPLVSPMAPEAGTENASATVSSVLVPTVASIVRNFGDEVSHSSLGPTVEGSAVPPVGCIPAFDIKAMTEAAANANANCTSGIACNRGATIVSPIILSLMGVTGQLAALFILHRTTRRQNARTVFYVMLCTLIWTDFFGKITTTPPAILAYAHGSWTGGLPLCHYHGYIMMVITMVTHLLVTSMAVERFLGIRHTYMYNRILTLSRAKFLLVGIWVFSLAFCALPMVDVGEYALQYPGTWCYLSLHPCSSTPLRHVLYANAFAFFNVVCLIFLVSCNVVVVGTLLKMRMFRYKFSPSKSCQPHRTSQQRELEVEMVIVLVVLTFVFTISWAPLDLRVFMNQLWPHEEKSDHFVELVAIRLVSINQIIDPWAYIISRFLFRSRFCRCCRTGFLIQRLSQRKSSNSLSLRRDSGISQRRESARSRKDSATTGSLRRKSDMSLRKYSGSLPPCRESGTAPLRRESGTLQWKESEGTPWREGELPSQRKESGNMLQRKESGEESGGTLWREEDPFPVSHRRESDITSLRKDSGNSSQPSSKRSSMTETPLLTDLGLDLMRHQQVQEEEEHLQEDSKLLQQDGLVKDEMTTTFQPALSDSCTHLENDSQSPKGILTLINEKEEEEEVEEKVEEKEEEEEENKDPSTVPLLLCSSSPSSSSRCISETHSQDHVCRGCRDSGTGSYSEEEHWEAKLVTPEELHLEDKAISEDVTPTCVPIPVFTCEQYTLLPLQHHQYHPHPDKSKNFPSEELILSVTSRTCRSLQGSPFKGISRPTLASCGCTNRTRGIGERPTGGRSSSWGCSMDAALKCEDQLAPSTRLVENLQSVGCSRFGSLALK